MTSGLPWVDPPTPAFEIWLDLASRRLNGPDDLGVTAGPLGLKTVWLNRSANLI